MDEPATAQALASFLRRGVACGAVTGADLARYDLSVLADRSLPGRSPKAAPSLLDPTSLLRRAVRLRQSRRRRGPPLARGSQMSPKF